MANPVDLTTVQAVKDYTHVESSTSDNVIASLITAFSNLVINKTGVNCFTNVFAYVETRDGNGSPRIFTRSRPIVNVVAITVNGVAVPASPSFSTPGYYVSDDQKQIVLRSVGTFHGSVPTISYRLSTMVFSRGIGNILLQYNAGYTSVPADLEMAARQAVAVNYKRTGTIDLASKSMSTQAGGGTTSYRDWELPPEVQCVIDFYSRNSLV